MTEPESSVHLIIVPCHAVLRDGGEQDPLADASWHLQPFHRSEPPFFVEHIRAGVLRAADDPGSLLVFSGGATCADTDRSEAEGYRLVADRARTWVHNALEDRVACESFARDSFQNLLFSLCRFREVTGKWPEIVTVLGWGFKRERYLFHAETIRWPADRFEYLGVNDPVDLESARRLERQNALEPYRLDPFGARDPLAAKRAGRNPHGHTPPYAKSCPEVAGLLAHPGPDPFPDPLPWDPPDPPA